MAEPAALDETVRHAPHGALMTIEAWEELDEDTPGEVVDGRLEEEEVPDSPHEIAVAWILHALRVWTLTIGGVALGSELKFALSKRSGRKPDLSVFFTRANKLPRRGATRHPPDVMVEVVSRRGRDRRRDRIEKLAEYAAFGVPWYWLVDPYARTLEVLQLGSDGRYTHALDAADGVVTVPGCEGLRLDLSALWREIDELVEGEGPESGE